MVRARNIFRKYAEQVRAAASEAMPDKTAQGLSRMAASNAAKFLAAPDGNAFWELALLAGSLGARIEQAVSAQEPAFAAKYAFQLAQAFNGFYHSHHILTETDEAKKQFLLTLTMLVADQLSATLTLLGIDTPEKM